MRDSSIKSDRIKVYYRLTKPGIIYGNMIAAIAGFLLASKNGFNVWLFIATMAGIALVIAAGCVFNNYTDIYIDGKMTRTKKRALVTGEIKPRSALIFGIVLAIIGFSILALWTNWLTVLVGVVGIVDYVALYAVAKRKTVHGTLVGTISGAAPPVAGYVAVTNQFDTGAMLLFAVMVVWQMAHFYAIAMFRASDYKAAHIPVLPLKQGMKTTKINIVLYICAFIVASLLLPLFGYAGYSYSVVVVVLGLVWLYVAVSGFRTTADILWARTVFKFSLYVLLGFSVMVALGNVLP